MLKTSRPFGIKTKMGPKPGPHPWKWDCKKELAAKLIAEGRTSVKEMVARVGISYPSIWKWNTQVPQFKARVESLTEAYRNRIRTSGIAVVENRVAELTDLLEAHQTIRHERALFAKKNKVTLKVKEAERKAALAAAAKAIANGKSGYAPVPDIDPMLYPVPGEKTGLILKRAKQVGDIIVLEHEADTALAQDIRATLRQAAQELGQWEEKQKVTGQVEVKRVIGVEDDAV